jgi:membrane-associated PAP2 superfamily phosphatase
MTEPTLLLAVALVALGVYVMYQHNLIGRYRRALYVATLVLEQAVVDITGELTEEDTCDS